MKPAELLPDGVDQGEINGVTVRKGTIGAFLVNAKRWQEAGASAQERAAAERDMLDLMPTLRALGLFEVMQIRDEALRTLLGQP